MPQATEGDPSSPSVESIATPSLAVDPDARAFWLIPALAALVAFAPTLGNGFVDWDDARNFLENDGYKGLGWPQICWAWTTFHLGVYQPLAWMLLEAQYALFGLRPWGYHLCSLLLYVAATVALDILVVALLGRCRAIDDGRGPWAIPLGAAIAVALFAAHPLRTEVVAWASCQPYLPCALFSILAILAYLRAHPDAGPWHPAWTVAAFLLFVAALLSKAVAVTLPGILLILDVYPLRRIGGRDGWFAGPSARRAWAEKLPYLAASASFLVLASWAKQQDFLLEAGVPRVQGPLQSRIAQACYGACFYLGKTFWPVGITAFYPLPSRLSLSDPTFLACGLLVAGTTAALVLARRRRPGLLAAWASYLLVLAPNSGLVRIGDQIAADRYSYMAMMGLVVLAAAGLSRALTTRRRALEIATVAGVALIGLTVMAWHQCRTWSDTLALWGNALAYGESPSAHNGLGVEFEKRGKFAEAEAHLTAALRLAPGFVAARGNLGNLLARQGKFAEAMAQLSEVLRLDPDNVKARIDMGASLALQGRPAEAEALFAEAVRLKPDDLLARWNLGLSLALQGKLAEAEAEYSEVLRRKPDDRACREALADIARRRAQGRSP